jgi:hypothetical protein
MKTLLTAISECDKKGFIEDAIRVAGLNGESIKHFSMGDMLIERLKSSPDMKFNPDNVLNMREEERAAYIRAIIMQIDAESEKYAHTIISGHASFLWKDNYTNAFDWDLLNVLNPDMYITLIDNTKRIKQKLDSSTQFSPQNMTEDDILKWQNHEVNIVKGWSQIQHKEHYILPRHESEGLLYKLMFHPEIEPVYASFPMTHITEEDAKIIDNFVKRLNEYFAIITPRSIELDKNYSADEGAQTILRDLKWFTKKVNKVIVNYLPHRPELPFSAGVWSEVLEGFYTTKDVIGLFPKKENYGPFEKYFIKMVNSEEEFFSYIESQGYKKHNIKM